MNIGKLVSTACYCQEQAHNFVQQHDQLNQFHNVIIKTSNSITFLELSSFWMPQYHLFEQLDKNIMKIWLYVPQTSGQTQINFRCVGFLSKLDLKIKQIEKKNFSTGSDKNFEPKFFIKGEQLWTNHFCITSPSQATFTWLPYSRCFSQTEFNSYLQCLIHIAYPEIQQKHHLDDILNIAFEAEFLLQRKTHLALESDDVLDYMSNFSLGHTTLTIVVELVILFVSIKLQRTLKNTSYVDWYVNFQSKKFQFQQNTLSHHNNHATIRHLGNVLTIAEIQAATLADCETRNALMLLALAYQNTHFLVTPCMALMQWIDTKMTVFYNQNIFTVCVASNPVFYHLHRHYIYKGWYHLQKNAVDFENVCMSILHDNEMFEDNVCEINGKLIDHWFDMETLADLQGKLLSRAVDLRLVKFSKNQITDIDLMQKCLEDYTKTSRNNTKAISLQKTQNSISSIFSNDHIFDIKTLEMHGPRCYRKILSIAPNSNKQQHLNYQQRLLLGRIFKQANITKQQIEVWLEQCKTDEITKKTLMSQIGFAYSENFNNSPVWCNQVIKCSLCPFTDSKLSSSSSSPQQCCSNELTRSVLKSKQFKKIQVKQPLFYLKYKTRQHQKIQYSN